jgi:hypothetical protein
MPNVSIIASTLIVNADPTDNAVSQNQYLNHVPPASPSEIISQIVLPEFTQTKRQLFSSNLPNNALQSSDHFSV